MYSSKTLVNLWLEERISPASSDLTDKRTRRFESELMCLGTSPHPLTRISRIKSRSTSGLISSEEQLASHSVYKEDFTEPKIEKRDKKLPKFINDGTIIELLHDSRRPIPPFTADTNTHPPANTTWLTTSMEAYKGKSPDANSPNASLIPAGARKGVNVTSALNPKKSSNITRGNDTKRGQHIFMDYP